MLVPHVRTVATALSAYRSAQADVLHDPANPLRYRRLDDTGYTLCVLTGQRNAADAVAQAEHLLARAPADGAAPRDRQAQTFTH